MNTADCSTIKSIIFSKDITDVHLTQDEKPWVRKNNGDLVLLKESEPISSEQIEEFYCWLKKNGIGRNNNWACSFPEESIRIRIKTAVSLAKKQLFIRKIPLISPKIDSLGVKNIINPLLSPSPGIFWLSGPTGSGKSTLLASLVRHYLENHPLHIVTIEDPVEYLFGPAIGSISQRQVGMDIESFEQGVNDSLREDPDVIMIGEARDCETLHAALVAAETGHLVLATVHATDVSGIIERTLGMFPGQNKEYMAIRISQTFLGGMALRLIKSKRDPESRVLAHEIVWGNKSVKSHIRDNRIHQLPGAIEASMGQGMHTLKQHLDKLISSSLISEEEANKWLFL